MQDGNSALELIKFAVSEVQEAGGSLLPRGLGARSPQKPCCAGYGGAQPPYGVRERRVGAARNHPPGAML